MKERIWKIIEQKNMTAAQFADRVGIQRSTLSHVLNGRNNASTELISKIHQAYPELNINWLMFGEGEMKGEQKVESHSLFDVFPGNNLSSLESNKTEHQILSPQKLQGKEGKDDNNSVAEKSLPPLRSIVKIMVFYSDNTFDTFSADNR